MAEMDVNSVLRFKDQDSLKRALRIIRPARDAKYEASVQTVAKFLRSAPKANITSHRFGDR